MKMINNIMKKNGFGVALCIALSFFAGTTNVSAQERLIVRSGDHPTYSRVVFDWERNVVYSAELAAGKLEIEFSANATPDFSSLLTVSPTYLSNPTYSNDTGSLKVTFDANNDGNIRHFRSGTKIVVDLMSQGAPSEVLTGAPLLSPVEEVISEEVVSVAEESISVASPMNDGDLTILADDNDDAFTISYVWEKDVRAAVFIRANNLWVVFDQHAVANHMGLSSMLGGRLKSFNQLDNTGSTILTYTIDSGQNARMVKMTNGWQVSLRSNIAVPQQPIIVGHQSTSDVGENIFLMADNLGNVINLEDPHIGDDLTIVTASQSSQGVMGQSNYPEFNILKSAQGIALQLIADDIFVTKHEIGVSVSGQNGLAVSKSSKPLLSDAVAIVEEGGQGPESQMLINFAYWEKGPLPDEGHKKNRHELLYELSRSSGSERNEARWNLATFNLANNNAAEAYGILKLMVESEPAFIENPSYRAALAVANIKMRRFDEAIELLNHRSLQAEMDALLWRSRAYEAMGEFQKSIDDFNVGVDVLSLQTNDNKAEFLFAVIRAANALNDIEYMNAQISGLGSARLNATQLTELDFWRGQLAEKYGDDVTAANEYDKVIATGVRYPASMAKFARINQQYRLKEIDTVKAIDGLEKLRFAWRGDDFELDLLKQLGELYVDQTEYREGLATLRQAATYFPRSTKTSDLTRKMSEIYNDLFLNGGADTMSPLKAMALFLEFRELTPLGTDGDTMSRNLASRMVAVDLLNDAADLLEHQVENRLQGVARADIASDLAKIYVMNKEPAKALEILRSTRQAQVPDDIELERNMIEIRSLVELGNYEEAEVMLEGVTGDVAEDLRSDIYWETDDWDRVVLHGTQKLGQRWSDSAELNASERKAVLRIAVALALAEDVNGLEQLRSQYMNHMENGMFADAFELITAKEQKTGEDIRELTQTIASVDRLETFMDSYRSEFVDRTNFD